MTIGERIKAIRENLHISQVDFADKINVSKQTLYKYENSIVTNIPSDKIEAIASIGNTSPAYIMGWEEDSPTPKKHAVTINVLGRVAAGIPMEAIENIIDTEEIDEELAETGEFFGLQINGDSMEPRMEKGDVVIVRKQETADSGDVVIALVNGTDATCKRLRRYRDGIELVPFNPSYDPIFYTNEEIETKPVRIIGKVVELRGKF